jgi:hypothetical protein
MHETGDGLSRYRNLLQRGAGLEEILGLLRRDGFSKVASIKALVDLGQADIEQAKGIVHESITWEDVRRRDDQFVSTLTKLSGVNKGGRKE